MSHHQGFPKGTDVSSPLTVASEQDWRRKHRSSMTRVAASATSSRVSDERDRPVPESLPLGDWLVFADNGDPREQLWQL